MQRHRSDLTDQTDHSAPVGIKVEAIGQIAVASEIPDLKDAHENPVWHQTAYNGRASGAGWLTHTCRDHGISARLSLRSLR